MNQAKDIETPFSEHESPASSRARLGKTGARRGKGARGGSNSGRSFARVEPVAVTAAPEAVIAAFCAGDHPAILETRLPGHDGAGFSVFACDPVDEFVHGKDDPSCPFTRFEAQVVGSRSGDGAPGDWPFGLGWIGYFSYESGLAVEGLVTRKQGQRAFPAAHWYRYDAATVFDHGAGRWYAVAVDREGTRSSGAAARRKLQRVRARLEEAREMAPPRGAEAAARLREVSLGPPAKAFWEGSEFFPARGRHVAAGHGTYAAAFDRAMGYIAAGDVYQVNLTQRYTVETSATPLEHYLGLRAISPSPYAAFLPWEEGAILCASPELFLGVREDRVVTRPIKGTRPRGGCAEEDRARRLELEASEKDAAELNMIIDLLRNDLGRVSRYGAVRVLDGGSIEAHPTVFHRVGAVEGALREGVGWAELLRATLPGGSVTGCPKVRALEVIDELEPHPREVYCGAIGMAGHDGSLTLNLAIRTMLQRGSTVRVYAGGAVVADSVVGDEYREIEAKAAAMLRALGAAKPGVGTCSA